MSSSEQNQYLIFIIPLVFKYCYECAFGIVVRLVLAPFSVGAFCVTLLNIIDKVMTQNYAKSKRPKQTKVEIPECYVLLV